MPFSKIENHFFVIINHFYQITRLIWMSILPQNQPLDVFLLPICFRTYFKFIIFLFMWFYKVTGKHQTIIWKGSYRSYCTDYHSLWVKVNVSFVIWAHFLQSQVDSMILYLFFVVWNNLYTCTLRFNIPNYLIKIAFKCFFFSCIFWFKSMSIKNKRRGDLKSGGVVVNP